MDHSEFHVKANMLVDQNNWIDLSTEIEKFVKTMEAHGFEETCIRTVDIITHYCNMIPTRLLPSLLITRLLGVANYLFYEGKHQQAMDMTRKICDSCHLQNLKIQGSYEALESVNQLDIICIQVDPESFGKPIRSLANNLSITSGLSFVESSTNSIFGSFGILSTIDLFMGLIARPLASAGKAVTFNQVNQVTSFAPENTVEELNCSYLATPLFWFNVLQNDSICLHVAPKGNEPGFIEPICSFYISIEMGIIGYIYEVNQEIVVPLYSGMGSYLEGLAIGNIKNNQLALITNSKSGLSLRCLEKVTCSLEHLLTNKVPISTLESDRIENYIIIGSRTNFGHTIINDSAYLGTIRYLATHNIKFNLMLANHDFLSGLELLNSVGINAIASAAKWSTINNYKTSINGLFLFPSIAIFPVSTLRPVSATLQLVSEHCACTSIQDGPLDRQALYLQLDNRSGSRRIINLYEIIDFLFSSCSLYSYDTVVLDGLTRYPIYTRFNNDLIVDWQDGSLSLDVMHYISQAASNNNLRLVVVDNKTIPEKLTLAAGANVTKAIVPYGSGAMTPIYLLNVQTGLLGSETYSSLIQAWKWHVTRYCHPFRVTEEVYIRSAKHSDSGYEVDLGALEQFLIGM